MAAMTDRGIPLSALSPKFLHTNSTSHTWPFSAIAELIDNAYDPDVNAKKFWIDRTRIKNVDCLTFVDNGNGLSFDKMHKMLSFGFSDKKDMKDHAAIGLYGNGFKSGSMRLGKDAIVFSKTEDSVCVGMLSQTYLEKTQASHVVVPIVSFRCGGPSMLLPTPEHSASLQDILKYSLFQTESELKSEVLAIAGHGVMATTGTRIIIWNLRTTVTGEMEFDFDKDRYDIQIPATVLDSNRETYKRPERVMESPPESDFSLRAYCSILYLKPRMQIIIRGQQVKTQLMSKNLAHTRKDKYKPNFLKKPVRITFGYNTKNKNHYGIIMYHKNRLIKAYQRVGIQLKAHSNGVGVIGVIECNFLKPTHNKQDFDYTDEYRKTISNVAMKLEEYWKEIHHERNKKDPNCSVPVEDTMMHPDQNWVQCDKCLKWRRLQDGIDRETLPEKWFCKMNPDPQYRSCKVPEEKEDSDDEDTYTKTYKQLERNRKLEAKRKKLEMEKERQEEKARREREDLLEREKDKIMRNNRHLTRQLNKSEMAADSPNGSSVLSQTDFTGSEGWPSTPSRTPRMKRKQGAELEGAEAKQARNGYSPGSEAAIALSPAAAWLTPEAVHSNIKHDSDDDVIIDETTSTPKPKTPTISWVKTEQTSDVECSDATAPEVPRTKTSPATLTHGALSPEWAEVSTATQTETSVAIWEKNEEVKNTAHDRQGGTEVGLSRARDGDEGWVAVVHPQEPTPVNNVPLAEAQQQQDQLMEKTALERDAYQTKVQQLMAKVKDLEQNVLELTQQSVKEQSHQACQTHYAEGEGDHKSLQQQREQLQKERDALAEEKRQWEEKNKGEGINSGPPQKQQTGEEASFSAQVNVDDKLVLQVDLLLRKLDQSNMERDELKNKLASLEVERAALLSQMERMQKELEELRKAVMGSANEEAGMDVAGQTHGSPDPHGKEKKHRENQHIAACGRIATAVEKTEETTKF